MRIVKNLLPRLSVVLFGCHMAAMVFADNIQPVLKEGASGVSADVKLLQATLNKSMSPSPGLAVDGSFGPATKAAVVAFQQSEGLAADGVVGTGTWKKLFRVSLNSSVTISAGGVAVLRELLDEAGLETATITSGVRTAADQARVMYDNIKEHGSDHQKKLYGDNGDMVIDVYLANATKPREEVIALMLEKINTLKPSEVSKHCSTTHDVFDVDPAAISDKARFESALKAAKEAGKISGYILPPADPAYHIEREK